MRFKKAEREEVAVHNDGAVVFVVAISSRVHSLVYTKVSLSWTHSWLLKMGVKIYIKKNSSESIEFCRLTYTQS